MTMLRTIGAPSITPAAQLTAPQPTETIAPATQQPASDPVATTTATKSAVEGAATVTSDPVPVTPGDPRTTEVDASNWRPSARLGDNLKRYGTDLTEAAANGELRPAFGRAHELEQIEEILGRPTNNNPVLLGESGVGKTALFEELARRIVSGEVPEHLQNRRMVLIDLNAMTAGTTLRGEFEERLDGVIKEIEASKGMIIPVIDELHMIVDAGAAKNTSGASEALKPALARGKLRLIGATTPKEYDEKIRSDAALHRRFSTVMLNEPNADATLRILQGSAPFLEGKSGLVFTNDALKAVQEMSSRYVVDRFQPAKAIEVASQTVGRMTMLRNSPPREVIDMREKVEALKNEHAVLARESSPKSKEQAAKVAEELAKVKSELDTTMTMWNQAARIARGERPDRDVDVEKLKARFPELFRTEILREDVAKTISDRTGVPVGAVNGDEQEKLKHLDENLKKQVVGQDEAISALANAIRRGRTGVSDPGKPVANILMIGPPGVGKTETAKAAARVMFDNPESLTRFNMGEYGTPGSRERLIDDISDAMRKRPFSVVLLDEIEKGHPSIYDGLMTALGEGKLKDSHGRTADLSNSVVLLASNMQKDDLPNFFRPEFIDRMDDIVEYHNLDKDSLSKIADIQINRLAKQVSNDLTLDVSSAARDKLVDLGYAPETGARNLKRVIERTIGNAIANQKIDGTLKPGMTFKVDVDENGELTFTPVAAGS
ncbi:MAG: AAA family ATPase [Thermoleophilia bacterium]|nr:AAA family ATPase [Thermoleophilia bacterium]